MSKNFLTPGFVPGTVPSGKKLSPKNLSNNNSARFENRKVPLGEGKSLNDWIRLANNSHGKDLAGTEGKILKVTEDDMAKHADISKGNVWIVLNGKVFNVTPYLEYHPGGIDEIMRAAGTDATGLFNEIHPWVAWDSMLKACFVGHFVGRRENLRPPDQAVTTNLAALSVIDGCDQSSSNGTIGTTEYYSCVIMDIRKLTHDTNLYILKRPSTGWHQGNIPLGSHVYFKASIQNTDITRPYTIVVEDINYKLDQNLDPEKLYFIIKIYNHGLFTQYLKDLKKGDSIQVSNVYANFNTTRLFSNTTENIYLFAAGTGFTPFVRILNETIKSKNVHMCFFNKTERDIIWRDKLEKSTGGSFKLTHVLSEADDSWKGIRGRISDTYLQDLLKDVKLSTLFICICGPIGFNEEALRLLQKYNFLKEQIHVFSG